MESVKSSTKIKVDRLTRNVTSKHVEEIFKKFGTIKCVTMPIDTATKRTLGYAIIEYADHAAPPKAIERFHKGQLDGSILKVTLDTPETQGRHKTHDRDRSRDHSHSHKH